jgi:hypothetical protein
VTIKYRYSADYTVVASDVLSPSSCFSFVVTRRWEDNIKINFQKVGGGCGDWMELAQDRDRWRALVGTVRNFRVP